MADISPKSIPELEAEIERLRHLVYYDELTGILNRRGFLHEVANSFGDVLRQRQDTFVNHRHLRPVTVLFLDVDNFKSVNDTHGHDAGDQVLKSVAKILPHNVRSHDLTARWGGEEFIVALVGADEAIGMRVAERIRADVERATVAVGDAVIRATVSIGLVQLREQSTLDELIANADEAMYLAKQHGKNRVMVFGV